MRCASGGRPWSSEPSQSGTGRTDRASHRCTTMGRTVMSARPRGWYDTLSLFLYVFLINLFVTLDSMLQKKSTEVKPHYLDVWLPAHGDDEATTEKLVSNNIKCYAYFIIYPYLLNIMQE
jgi:hypothetical protein